MQKSRCLGLIGGLGVGATVHYYEKLTKGCETLGLEFDIVITNAQTPRIFEYVEATDRDGLAEYLNGYIRRMNAAGAEIAAIPAVTPHFCEKELLASSPVPVISIFEPLQHELSARAARRLAIFGTRYVIAAELFGALKDVEVIRAQTRRDRHHSQHLRRISRHRQGLSRKTRAADGSREDNHPPRQRRRHHSRRNGFVAAVQRNQHRFSEHRLCGAAYRRDPGSIALSRVEQAPRPNCQRSDESSKPSLVRML